MIWHHDRANSSTAAGEKPPQEAARVVVVALCACREVRAGWCSCSGASPLGVVGRDAFNPHRVHPAKLGVRRNG